MNLGYYSVVTDHPINLQLNANIDTTSNAITARLVLYLAHLVYNIFTKNYNVLASNVIYRISPTRVPPMSYMPCGNFEGQILIYTRVLVMVSLRHIQRDLYKCMFSGLDVSVHLGRVCTYRTTNRKPENCYIE